MNNIKYLLNYIQYAGAGIGTVISLLVGRYDFLFEILIALTVLDFITGVLSAIYNKKLSSAIGYRGIVRLYERSYKRRVRINKENWYLHNNSTGLSA